MLKVSPGFYDLVLCFSSELPSDLIGLVQRSHQKLKDLIGLVLKAQRSHQPLNLKLIHLIGLVLMLKGERDDHQIFLGMPYKQVS